MSAAALHDAHVTAWRDWRHSQAQRFLHRLDPEAEAFTFQTFDDTPAKRRDLAGVKHGGFDRLAATMDRLNARRAGVFVTVAATDGKGRQAHNVERVRAVFVDLDGAPLAPALEAGLEPHIVTESSPGRWHCYWLTDDCTRDQFERVQRALARRFGGDPSVHDLPRVMRVPGFRHWKGKACIARLLDEIGTTAPPYSLAKIVSALELDLNTTPTPRVRQNGDGGKIAPGNRHAHLFAIGRSMARKGSAAATIRAALAAENAARCDPPLLNADIDYLTERASKAKDAEGWPAQAQRDATDADDATHQPNTLNATAGDPHGGETSEGSEGDAKQTVAQVLIAIGARCDLFHDERGDGHVVAAHNGIRRTLRLRGREFRSWLRGRYYAESGKAANGEAIAAALGVLEAKATFDGQQITLFNRFAEQDRALYIDMCDNRWRAVKVTANGWEVLDKPPVLFRRFSHQQPLPDPQRGGDLAALDSFLNLRNAEDRHLTKAWLAAAPFCNAPRPALMLHGPQGAAKTTLARALKNVLDPSATDTIDLGRDPAALAQVLDHNAAPVFDNITGIPTWAGDMLCKAVTGGGFSKRELYTDAEDVILTFKRAVIVTGINIPTHAPDLLDRMLLVELERIAPEDRRDEREFWTKFNAALPRLFGAILDAISGVLRYRDQVRLARLPRMADFAELACAYAEHTGIGSKKMVDIIIANAGRQTQEVIESDALATAVLEFIKRLRCWEGTATELHAALSEPYLHPKKLPEGWPKSPKSLGRRLNSLQATLAEVGITIARKPSPDGKDRHISLTVGTAKQTSEMSEMSEVPTGAASAPDVSSRPVLANVGETSEEKLSAGAASDISNISDNTLHNPTAAPVEVGRSSPRGSSSAADADVEVIT